MFWSISSKTLRFYFNSWTHRQLGRRGWILKYFDQLHTVRIFGLFSDFPNTQSENIRTNLTRIGTVFILSESKKCFTTLESDTILKRCEQVSNRNGHKLFRGFVSFFFFEIFSFYITPYNPTNHIEKTLML